MNWDSPKNEAIVRLDRAYRRRREPPRPDDDLVSAYIDGTVTLRSNRPEQRVKSSGKEFGYQRVVKGDLVISGMNAHLGGLGISDSDGRCTPVYLVLEPQLDLDDRFVSYQLRHLAKSGFLKSITKTIRYNSSDFKEDDLSLIRLNLPSLDEQRRIADFLDTETARLDALIDARRQLVLLVGEKRTATIRAEMNFSPESMTRIRYVARVKRGQSPRPITDPQYFDDDGSHGWVRIEDVTRSSMYLRETRQRLSVLGKSRSVPVGPGVVLVSIAASVGKPIITDMDCCYHDGFVGLLDLRANPEFAYFWLSLPERFAGMEQIGTQANINSDIVGSVRFPVLPMDEQRRIAVRITARLAEIDALVGALEEQLALLVEYRQSLIANAVTGQLAETTFNGSRPIDDEVPTELSV